MNRRSILALIVLASTSALPWQAQIGGASQDKGGRPHLVVLIDTSASMSVTDFHDEATRDTAKKLAEGILARLKEEVPGRIEALRKELADKAPRAEGDADIKAEVDFLQQRLAYWQQQQDAIGSNKWLPNRLQLAQALLTQSKPNWLDEITSKQHVHLHVYHLDSFGRARNLCNVEDAKAEQLERAAQAINGLEAIGKDSRLGTALRQIIDQHRGETLAGVIMLTDGVTTRDETIADVAEYAAKKGTPLHFVGLGSEQARPTLKLHDLSGPEAIYLGDDALFEVRLTAQGYKNAAVSVVLKFRDAKDENALEREVGREVVKLDPDKTTPLRMRHQPKEVGRGTYVIEAVPTRLGDGRKPIAADAVRLERQVEIRETKTIKVLYVESQPRYEFRAIKSLLERTVERKPHRFELKVLLLDADEDFAAVDQTALKHFPPTLEDLNRYDVIILGDCDPKHKKLRSQLNDIVRWVRGEDEKGRKTAKPGGGLLFIAGSAHNPHQFKGTPLADVLPIEPTGDAAAETVRRDEYRFRPELTPAGRTHPVFRFDADREKSAAVFGRLAQMYWASSNYQPRPHSEVLAVHPRDQAEKALPNQPRLHPIVVEQSMGSGRSMFFGVDETWRWRFREDESQFSAFWMQTIRYLARGPTPLAELRLDRHSPYAKGQPIRVSLRLPMQADSDMEGRKDVRVAVSYWPPNAKETDVEKQTLQLAEAIGSARVFEGILNRAREGKYRFELVNPAVALPNGAKPSAEAIVAPPPGELDRVAMNRHEMLRAAEATNGTFATLNDARRILDAVAPKKR